MSWSEVITPVMCRITASTLVNDSSSICLRVVTLTDCGVSRAFSGSRTLAFSRVPVTVRLSSVAWYEVTVLFCGGRGRGLLMLSLVLSVCCASAGMTNRLATMMARPWRAKGRGRVKEVMMHIPP